MIQDYPTYLFHQAVCNVPFDAKIDTVFELTTVKVGGKDTNVLRGTAKDDDETSFMFSIYGIMAKSLAPRLFRGRKITIHDWTISACIDDIPSLVIRSFKFIPM